MQGLMKSADLCFNSFSILQDRLFYHKKENREGSCHHGQLNKSTEHQYQDEHIVKQTHLMEIYAEMEQHFQQLNADLLSSTKENGKSQG
jgi:hypothetical protein